MSSLFERLSPWWLWALLSLPALGILVEAATAADDRVLHALLHPTGETSARLLIITLTATPLMILFKGWRGPRWLVRNRRYFGVAAFGYAALHTAFYLMSEPLARILQQATAVDMATGWLAFALFLPLAATSFDAAVRAMGTWWKWLQRWTYLAAVLTLLHWAALHDWRSPGAAIVHFAPLIALEAYRAWWLWLRPRPGGGQNGDQSGGQTAAAA
jgi:sulfoxide reductase heme-binding subunit YedZ